MFSKYLLVGVWNTVFGFVAYSFLTYLFTRNYEQGYFFAAVISYALGVTHSYLTYKFFVFKTRGNYLAEYIKCWSVYLLGYLGYLMFLPLSVECIKFILSSSYLFLAPYIGGLVANGIVVLISYFGHKELTFKK